MRVCKVRNILFAHRQGIFLKVRVVDGVDGINSFAPVEPHEIFDE